jgi:hypothetical protein
MSVLAFPNPLCRAWLPFLATDARNQERPRRWLRLLLACAASAFGSMLLMDGIPDEGLIVEEDGTS